MSFTIICGPCVMESEEHVMRAAEELKAIFDEVGLELIFKASYDKANRSSLKSFRGPGLEKGLKILERVKSELGLKVSSDVHSPEQARAAGQVLDIVQIPAFLCRQTDLLVAAAETGKPVNVKKGQFMAPWDMGNVVLKLQESGCAEVILTDRGASFGYNNLVSDFRAIPIMQKFGCKVCFDATHSVQLPGGAGSESGGQSEFVPVLAKAAIAAGCDLLFMEAHENPSSAKSDRGCQLNYAELKNLLPELKRLRAAC